MGEDFPSSPRTFLEADPLPAFPREEVVVVAEEEALPRRSAPRASPGILGVPPLAPQASPDGEAEEGAEEEAEVEDPKGVSLTPFMLAEGGLRSPTATSVEPPKLIGRSGHTAKRSDSMSPTSWGHKWRRHPDQSWIALLSMWTTWWASLAAGALP